MVTADDSSDGLLAAIAGGPRHTALERAAAYWDEKFNTRRGLHAALLALVEAGRLEADVRGAGERRVVTNIRGLSADTHSAVFEPEPATLDAPQLLEDTNDRRSVFVVHGQDEVLRKSMFDFLRSLDLHPMEWSELTGRAGSGNPYIGELLDLAFGMAQAVVVLFTPDEAVQLAPHLVMQDPQSGLQSRPNVIFEAGLAMGRKPERTVLVEVGPLRRFSDLAGRHSVRLDDQSARKVALRQDLAQRLEAAGCPVTLRGTDWHDAGDFVVHAGGDR